MLEPVGEPEAARQLRLHFELRVYATLRGRGFRELAERYRGHSSPDNTSPVNGTSDSVVRLTADS